MDAWNWLIRALRHDRDDGLLHEALRDPDLKPLQAGVRELLDCGDLMEK
jgi:hypothetical protein